MSLYIFLGKQEFTIHRMRQISFIKIENGGIVPNLSSLKMIRIKFAKRFRYDLNLYYSMK